MKPSTLKTLNRVLLALTVVAALILGFYLYRSVKLILLGN